MRPVVLQYGYSGKVCHSGPAQHTQREMSKLKVLFSPSDVQKPLLLLLTSPNTSVFCQCHISSTVFIHL